MNRFALHVSIVKEQAPQPGTRRTRHQNGTHYSTKRTRMQAFFSAFFSANKRSLETAHQQWSAGSARSALRAYSLLCRQGRQGRHGRHDVGSARVHSRSRYHVFQGLSNNVIGIRSSRISSFSCRLCRPAGEWKGLLCITARRPHNRLVGRVGTAIIGWFFRCSRNNRGAG